MKEVISFDIAGKLAHFRKYYANNTALSYYIPPRTTVMGMLAGILGLPRDSYYQALASDRIRIGIRVISPIKKTFHRLNLLRVVGDMDFRGKQGRVQTPFEMVSGYDLLEDQVQYRIFVSYYPEGEKLFTALKDCLIHQRRYYATTLGLANLNASISNVREIEDAAISEMYVVQAPVLMHAAMPSIMVDNLDGEPDKIWMEEELFPLDFMADHNRELSKMQRLLYSLNEAPLPLIISGTYYTLKTEGETENICFIE
jgi:CRISPR-associated protein Cas5h